MPHKIINKKLINTFRLISQHIWRLSSYLVSAEPYKHAENTEST